jgi:hypothetical protein
VCHVQEIRQIENVLNRVLRRIFAHKRDEVTGGWRKCKNELRSLYSLLNIIRSTRSGSMGWARRVARMRGKRNACS